MLFFLSEVFVVRRITYNLKKTDMEIKVLGTGCTGCRALYETTRRVVEELALEATVVKEEDIVKIMSYDVMQLPALVVDGEVVAKGRKLSPEEVKELLSR